MIQKLLLFVPAVLLLWACGNDPEPQPSPGPDPELPTEPVRRTVLVYQVANRNGLAENSVTDIDEMRKAVAEGQTGSDGRLVVYNHRSSNKPMLIEILPDRVDTIATYTTDISSADARRMTEVFADMERLRPAAEYGLILWGHGSGWLQDGRIPETDGKKRSYGGDNGQWMNISVLADVLRQGPAFEYLYFDCCYMASVEVAYEIGTAVPRIAGSVIEIASEGMPYHRTLRHFFSSEPDALTQAAAATLEYYREWSRIGSRPECSPESFSGRYCAMSVVETSRLEALADAARTIFARTPALYPSGITLQRYGRGEHRDHYFDLGTYMRGLCLDGSGAERYTGASADLEAFRKALVQAVIYNEDMGYVFGSVSTITDGCGLSSYVLRDPSNINDKNNYNTLAWYADVVSAFEKQ